jgi:hypothetical protein
MAKRRKSKEEATQWFALSEHRRMSGALDLSPPLKERRALLRKEVAIIALTQDEEIMFKSSAGNADAWLIYSTASEGNDASLAYLHQRFRDAMRGSKTDRFLHKFYTAGMESRARRVRTMPSALRVAATA